jgi:hypothetical protein
MWTAVQGDAAITSLDLTPLDGSTASYHHVVSGTQWEGSPTGDMVPGSSCCVSLYTGDRGRSKRGRVFLPWLAESEQTAGTITPTTVSDTVAAWNTFIAAMTTATYPLVVASYKLASYAAVTSVRVRPGAATQRRRQERVRYP